MSEKLSPPILEGVIPAFYSDKNGIAFTIPFFMNRKVGSASVSGFSIKMKTAHSSQELFTQEIVEADANDNTIKSFLENKELVVQINNKTEEGTKKIKALKTGQFYKIQIAYIDNNGIVGYYSNVGIAKYTCKPTVSIRHLNHRQLNAHSSFYEGEYTNSDLNEKPYSYCFIIYNENNEVFASSGELLYDASTDSDLTYYTFLQELPSNGVYQIEYNITTVNGLKASSGKYNIIQRISISSDLQAELLAYLNYENGYIDLELNSDLDSLSDRAYNGSFVITRASEDSDYSIWKELKRFRLNGQATNLHLWRDFTIEQGKKYIYAIQQYNDNGLYSGRIKSNIITADFEDVFLYDGKRQLKIKYNPKVSSFKKTVLETKIDTIGSKYPFVFKNNNVYYGEFPISGLISYFMDEDNLFFLREDWGFENKTIDLSGDNIALEREFKMLVLEWLTNGEPKLFRSPTEGNYIVRLMNVSLAPNDTLGRMLHTFSCTAYEVYDSNNIENFIYYSIVEDLIFQTETIQLAQIVDKTVVYADANTTLNRYPAKSVRFQDMVPGTVVKIRFQGERDFISIIIGATGKLNIDTGINITDIQINEKQNQGQITYNYKLRQADMFNEISSISYENRIETFSGACDILKKIQYVTDDVKNPKISITKIHFIQSEKNVLGESDNSTISIDGSVINLNETGKFFLEPSEEIKSIINGADVLTTISYEVSVVDYNIEDGKSGSKDNAYLAPLYEAQKTYKEKAKGFYKWSWNYQQAYVPYILALVKAQEEEKRLKGVTE